MPRRYYAVTRINAQVALLADDDGSQIAVPLNRLPRGTASGAVLLVPLDHAGTPAWSQATIDAEEAKRRLRDVGADGSESKSNPDHSEEA